jgi:HTH-type transcriptional regulator / antitoxin HipB
VRSRRRELGLRQEDLAEMAGVSVSFLKFLERDKPSIQLSSVKKVLDVLGLELVVRVRKP